MENKKSPHFKNTGRKNKGKKKYLINMPEELGLPTGKKYYFIGTKNGYKLNYDSSRWIEIPRVLIENMPQHYTLILKGEGNE